MINLVYFMWLTTMKGHSRNANQVQTRQYQKQIQVKVTYWNVVFVCVFFFNLTMKSSGHIYVVNNSKMCT